jgi:hypothetical protein
MNRFPGPNRLLSLLYPLFLISGIVFVLGLVYGFIMHDEYDEDDEVTITFNCSQVLGSQNNYPEFVINQCKQLRRGL